MKKKLFVKVEQASRLLKRAGRSFYSVPEASRKGSEKSGAILVIVMAVLVAFSLMVVALLQLGSFNEMETIRQLRTTQAHWLAEAGLERALSWVIASETYRKSLDGFNPEFPSNSNDPGGLPNGMSYAVEITRIETNKDSYGNALFETYKYTIISTGMTMGATAAVRLDTQIGPRGQAALIGLGGNSTIHNSPVNGNVYQDSGKLTFDGSANQNIINGSLDAASIGSPKKGTFTEGEIPDPGPPQMDTTIYNSYTNDLDKADSYNDNLVHTNGKTRYVDGPYTIIDAPTGSKWVINGAVTVSATIQAGATIVAAGIVDFPNHVTLEAKTTIFTKTNITFGVDGVTGTETALLAMGNIIATNHFNIEGVIFAGGTVTIATQGEITGTLIAGLGFDIKNTKVTYDPTVFPVPNPIQYGNGNPVPQPGTWQWQEIP
jgi:hypothetical protein